MKRPVRHAGRCSNGHEVLEAQNPDGSIEKLHTRRLKPGEPMPLGADALHIVERQPDGTHAATTIATRKGPPRVATRAYRTNHHAVFGPTDRERELMN